MNTIKGAQIINKIWMALLTAVTEIQVVQS
jgi:hypothetical protein